MPASRCRDGAYGEAQSVCGLQEAAAADINIFREYNARRAACSTRSCRRVVEEGGKVWIAWRFHPDRQLGEGIAELFSADWGSAHSPFDGLGQLPWLKVFTKCEFLCTVAEAIEKRTTIPHSEPAFAVVNTEDARSSGYHWISIGYSIERTDDDAMMEPTTHQPPTSPTPLDPSQHPQRNADADAGPGTTARTIHDRRRRAGWPGCVALLPTPTRRCCCPACWHHTATHEHDLRGGCVTASPWPCQLARDVLCRERARHFAPLASRSLWPLAV